MVLTTEDWRARADAHGARLAPYLDPHLARREAGVRHPVHDFLFSYYSLSPAKLRQWHPGSGIALREAPEHATIKGYAAGSDGVVRVDPAYVDSQQRLLRQIHILLRATADRPGTFGCFGLHEWAMVYRLGEDQTRHSAWPLRLGSAGTDEVVESHRIVCSHFDAFRFFTPPARPLNTLSPGRDDRAAFEQPGCLHATMDLYKHAFRLLPMVGSDLLADAFELAWQVRIMDMRAAPYDLTGVTLDPTGDAWTPIRIETQTGRQEYAAAQRDFATQAAPLRQRLIKECERLLAGLRGPRGD